MGGMGGGFGFAGGPPAAAEGGRRANDPSRVDLQKGVSAAARGEDVGEMFRYVIKNPVSLPRRQSAMLPIVNGPVDGEKVGIYNSAVHVKHPLNGLKLKNSTGLHLMQGPITVFDGGEYAGDSRITDVPPGSSRLITYALDQDTEVAAVATTKQGDGIEPDPFDDAPPVAAEEDRNTLVSLRIAQGVLHKTVRQTRRNEYLVKNSGNTVKRILIEKPIDANWQLVLPREPAEKTRDLYRLAVIAEPGKPTTLKIEEQRTSHQELKVGALAPDQVAPLLKSKAASPAIRAALTEVMRRQQELAKVADQRGQLEQSIAEINQEQSRIRQNLEAIDKTSDLYVRYIKKFTQQEEQIEQARPKIKELRANETMQRQALEKYVLELNAE